MANGTLARARIIDYLVARTPFVSVRTAERSRATHMITSIARERQLDLLIHTPSQGLRDVHTGAQVGSEVSLWSAFVQIGQQLQTRRNLTIVLTDVPQVSDDNETTRLLMDLTLLAEQRGGTLVLITADPVLPTLQRLGMSIHLEVPDYDEMRDIIQQFLTSHGDRISADWAAAEFERATAILCGVTKIEAENILAVQLARGQITRSTLIELASAKEAIFSDLTGIERVHLREKEYEVGGLGNLHRWLDEKRPLLTMDLRSRGLRPPRGVLLLGVPGCGKSLSAKAVAARWGMPLYRLDVASIFGMYVGQSESRFKQALETADAVAPCVLWIDEIEKGLAGSGTESTGVTTRMVGQLLYWLQESHARVFVVATANDVRALPQELLRTQRFDKVFFIDLPTPRERREIIQIFVKRHLRIALAETLLDRLVDLSDGFAGSDIQAAVVEICHEALQVGDENVPDRYFIEMFRSVVPLSRTAPERIKELRELTDRATPASDDRGRALVEAHLIAQD